MYVCYASSLTASIIAVGVEPESERASLLPFYVVETDLIQIVVEEMLTKV